MATWDHEYHIKTDLGQTGILRDRHLGEGRGWLTRFEPSGGGALEFEASAIGVGNAEDWVRMDLDSNYDLPDRGHKWVTYRTEGGAMFTFEKAP